MCSDLPEVYLIESGRPCRHREVRRVQHENQIRACAREYRNAESPKPGLSTSRRYRPFLRAITAEIKSLDWRIGKDVVIRVVEIWELNSGSHLYAGAREGTSNLLPDFLLLATKRVAENCRQIDHGQRWLRRRTPALVTISYRFA